MTDETELLKQLSDLDRLQSQDILGHLKNLKRYGHRGQTSQEIVLNYKFKLSSRAVLRQINTLKKWKLVREIKLKYKNQKIILYEASQI